MQESARPRRITAAALAIGLGYASSPAGCASSPAVRIHTAAGRTLTVTVEIAATPAERERGLMFRSALADGHGMFFVFPRVTDHQFWMKNTPVALDIIFIDDDGRIVGIRPDTVPYSEARLSVGRPSRYVLEVAAGYCAREGVAVGDRVELPAENALKTTATHTK